MTQDLLTDIGEEWYTEHDVTTISIDVLVYNDGTNGNGDALSDTSDLSAITTEPTGVGTYSRETAVALTPTKISGNRGFENSGSFSFDLSGQDTEQWIDTFGIVYNFDSDEAGDGGTATDHLVANPAMTTDRDIGSMDDLNIAAGDISIVID